MVRVSAPLASFLFLVAASAGARPPDRLSEPTAVVFPMDRTVRALDPVTAARQVLGPRADLALTKVGVSLTGEHVRFQRLAPDGTRLVGAELSLHFVRPDATSYRTRLVTQSVADLPVLLVGERRVGRDQASAAAAAAGGGEVAELEPAALMTSAATATPGFRARVVSARHQWEVWVDGETGQATRRYDTLVRAEGSGFVFQPNPITTSGNVALRDENDADSATLAGHRVQVVLRGLDGSGFLRGEFADVRNLNTRAQSGTLTFDFQRADDAFEEVNTYYHIDLAQRFLQGLGYTGTRGVQALSFPVTVNGVVEDNSHYSPGENKIVLGAGGVDDAEDGHVIIHEYGHALQFGVSPGWIPVNEAAAIGEGFGDMIAFLVPQAQAAGLTPVCLAPWDATSYAAGPVPCMRRVDSVKHYPEHMDLEPHDDGEIWSGAIYDFYMQSGISAGDMTKLLIEMQHLVSNTATFAETARALITADQELTGGTHAALLRRVMTWHGLLGDIEPRASVGDRERSVTVNLVSGTVPDLADESMTFSEPGAEAIIVHFQRIEMEVDDMCRDDQCDRIYLYDGEGRLWARIAGSLRDHKSPPIPGDTVVVRWVSDDSNPSIGFTIDRLDIHSLEEGGGCGCRVGGGTSGPGAALLVLGVLGFALIRRGARAARPGRRSSRW